MHRNGTMRGHRLIVECLRAIACIGLFLIAPVIQAGPELVKAVAAIREVRLSGFTRARAVLDLATEADGKVEEVFADIGEPIGEDGRFACLDQTFIDLDLETNLSEIATAGFDIDFYKKEENRYRELVAKNNSSQHQLDEIQRNLANAKQGLRRLRIQRRELEERKTRYCIAAPPEWLVIARYIEPGEWVKTGDPVAQIGNFATLLIPYALTMVEFQAIQKKAAQIQVELPELGITSPARIAHVSPDFDEQSRKIVLSLAIEGNPARRRGGIRADLVLQLPDSGQSVLLPHTALDERYEQYWVERPNGERLAVVYLGPVDSADPKPPMVRISHPDIQPGQEFVVKGP